MNILVIGSGGRESALAWALSKSRNVEHLFVAPGNAGTALLGENLPIGIDELNQLIMTAWEKQVDLVVVGPEAPLVEGVADMMRNIGIPVFGPSRNAAKIESSKVFCKEFLARHNIPTGRFNVFDDPAGAHAHIDHCKLPVVIKADGLCQGKGVVVAKDQREAHQAIERMMTEKVFGEAGATVVIEEFLRGKECSFMVLCDGENIVPLLSSRDYKRAFDGDGGPNTGGMGAYAPLPEWTLELQEYCMETIIRSTVHAMAQEGRRFTGLLYAGLMITGEGPKLLEYNCRFGDPETQAVLPLLETDLADLLMSCTGHFVDNTLKDKKITWSQKKSVCVNVVSQGYPGNYEIGKKIEGIEAAAENPNVFVFHAGTVMKDNILVTNGGRVLNVVALGRDWKEARTNAYIAASKISFDGMRHRKDIALDFA